MFQIAKEKFRMCLHVPQVACNVLDMERRTPNPNPAAVLAATISGAGETAASVSSATGIPLNDLSDYLSGASDISIDDLGKVGGFLHISPSAFFEVAA